MTDTTHVPAGALRTWVELYEPLSEAPVNAHLGAAIALISAAIGWKASLRWGENEEPCTVNVILEGRSATARKTTVAGGAHTLAREAMRDIYEDARQLRTRSISHTSSRGIVEAIAPKDREQADKWEREPPPGVLLVWDEFGSVLGDPRDIKGAGWLGQVRATLMQLTAGRHGGIQTGGDKMAPGRCAVSVLATMTRVELEQRVSFGLLRDGFMGRFLLMPFNGRPRLLAAPPRWTAPMIRQRETLVEWLRAVAQADTTIGDIFGRMTDQAIEARTRWYEDSISRLERQATQDESEGSFAAVEAFGRLQTTALKIAVVAAVSEWRPEASEFAEITIDERHVHYGQDLADVCLREIIDLGEYAGVPRRDVYAERVKKYLAKHGPTPKKVLLDNVRAEGITRGDRWRVIEDLHPDTVEIVRRDTGGRPALVVVPVQVDDDCQRKPSADAYADTKVGGENGSTMRDSANDTPYAAYADNPPLSTPVSTPLHTHTRDGLEEGGHPPRQHKQRKGIETSNRAKSEGTYADVTLTNADTPEQWDDDPAPAETWDDEGA